MAEDQVRLGDYGTRFKLTLKDDASVVDISTASLLELLFLKPSGAVVTKTALLFTDGTDGVVYYDVEDGLIDEVGLWKYQVFFTMSTGFWGSSIGTFRVYPNLR